MIRAHRLLHATALVLTACAPGLASVHDGTRDLTDASTNLEVAIAPIGHPVCERPLGPAGTVALEDQKLREPPAPWAFREPPAPTRCEADAPIVATEPTRTPDGRPVFTMVHTDVDDTLFPSLWDRERYASHHPYPGVLELLAAEGQSLTVLTARPAPTGGLRSKICGMFQDELVDADACEGLDVSPGELRSITDSLGMGLVKAESLLRQRCEHPTTATVFNGDSGQGDWIAALIARDLDPTGVPYATIHDVRAWSPEHRRELMDAIRASDRLAAIYRRALPRREGEAEADHRARRAARLGALRHDVDAALRGPNGRLDGALLRARGIFLFRNHAELALDLADAGFVDRRAAERVARVAAPDLCLAPDNPFGFDDLPSRQRLVERLAAASHP